MASYSTTSVRSDSRPSSSHGDKHSQSEPEPEPELEPSIKSAASVVGDIHQLVIDRSTHAMTEEGYVAIIDRVGNAVEPDKVMPSDNFRVVQGFGLLVVLEIAEELDVFPVRMVSENSERIIGRCAAELFALRNFTDILSEDCADDLIANIDLVRDEDVDIAANGPEVFPLSIEIEHEHPRKLWCAVHPNPANSGLVICEFELEDDQLYPLVPTHDPEHDLGRDTSRRLSSPKSVSKGAENHSRPFRFIRGVSKRRGATATSRILSIMSQVQDQLSAAKDLERLLQVLVGILQELTGFHRVMAYQYDHSFNARVITEVVDTEVTEKLYVGLNFPASDIPKHTGKLHKNGGICMLYDHELKPGRLICRSAKDLETPLNLTHCYLREALPIHSGYLANTGVRSSMSIPIDALDDRWGLVACHSYGSHGMRTSFATRKMCQLICHSASRNIERLSYKSRLHTWKFEGTIPAEHSLCDYVSASSDELLSLFGADFGMFAIGEETKIMGHLEQPKEAITIMEYLKTQEMTSVVASTDLTRDFPDIQYPPGFDIISGVLIIPVSAQGNNFIVFFRAVHLESSNQAGDLHEKLVDMGTEACSEPRKIVKPWSETEIKTASVLCLGYKRILQA